MAKITREMVDRLNDELKNKGVGFMYIYKDEDTVAPTMKSVIVDNNLNWILPDTGVYCKNTYYNWLENWFKTNYDITLDYNNTKNYIWSNDFS